MKQLFHSKLFCNVNLLFHLFQAHFKNTSYIAFKFVELFNWQYHFALGNYKTLRLIVEIDKLVHY